MKIQGFDKWNLFSYSNSKQGEQMQRLAEHPKMKELEGVTVTFSKEGISALHGQQLKGAVDVEEMKRMEEILPKLSMNPSDEFYWAMREDMSKSMQAIKENKGNYGFDDLLSVRMAAYANQYDSLVQAHEDGSRDVYVCDGEDENGKLQFHKLSIEEDIACLDAAFSRIAESLVYSARAQEATLEINERFGGKQNDIELPENYEGKLKDIFESAMQKYKDSKSEGEYINASALVLQFFNQDTEFAGVMRQLYEA